jgi:molecular chaperone HscB
MMQAQCPSCARLQEPRLCCFQCGAPLAVELDYFAALGLPRRLTIDLKHLEHLYHDLGRRVHPDRFASRPAVIRAASLSATALLTRSFRTLRDPVSRGLYWLELQGEKLGRDNKQVPPELTELIFEVQETLEELRSSNSNGGPVDESLRRGVTERKQELDASMREALGQLDRNFTRWDEDQGSKPELTLELKSILSRIAYLRTLIRDVDRELDSHDLR